MFRLIRNYAGPLFWSVMLHAVVFVLLVVTLAQAVSSRRVPPPQVAMKATVVDEGLIEKELERLKLEDQRERLEKEREQRRLEEEAEKVRRAKDEEQRKLEALQVERQAEEKRQVELKRKREEQEAQRLAEAKRKQQEEEQRLADIERKQRAEKERLAKLEQERREKERLAKAERERKAEAERRRVAEAAALAAALAAEEKAEFQASLLEEEQRIAATNSGLLDQYRTLISQKVERKWNRPASARPGIECEVHVKQIIGGEVVDVRVGRCNADEAVVRSIEAAVKKASPLPRPPDPSLFERNLIFEFRPAE